MKNKPDTSTSPLFRGLNDSEMVTLSSVMVEKKIEDGVSIFVENMPGESLYLIETGAVKISKMIAEGDEQCLAVLGPLDSFGEMALVDPAPRSVTARVMKTSSLWSMKKKDFDNLCLTNPILGMKLLRNILTIFAERIRESDQEIRNLIICGK